MHITTDKAVVFQRAFWRHPDQSDRIIAAERRDRLDESFAVQQWQWFIAVDPSPALSRWLIVENPFEIAAVAAGTTLPPLEGAPEWFPTPSKLAACTQYSAPGSRFWLFLDPTSGRLFAADYGAGFSAARR